MSGASELNKEQNASNSFDYFSTLKFFLILLLLCCLSFFLFEVKPFQSSFEPSENIASSNRPRQSQEENQNVHSLYPSSSFAFPTLQFEESKTEDFHNRNFFQPSYRRRNIHKIDEDEVNNFIEQYFSDSEKKKKKRRERRFLLPELSHYNVEESKKPDYNVSFVSVPLFGDVHEMGYYYAMFNVGTPPQKQSVIVDTGSSIFGFPCSYCEHCSKVHRDQFFNTSQSSTLKWISCSDPFCSSNRCTYSVANNSFVCSYALEYIEGSAVEGQFFSDIISINPTLEKRCNAIGCHTRETLLFLNQSANGIIGLAPSMNFKKGNSPIDELLSSFPNDKKIVSLCLGDKGGYLELGLPNLRKNETLGLNNDTSKIVWTKTVGNKRNDIFIEKITIQKKNMISNNARGNNFVLVAKGADLGICVVDSGTTFTYFPRIVFEAVKKELLILCTQKNCKNFHNMYGENICWKAHNINWKAFPNFEFYIRSSKKIIWRPQSYLVLQSLEAKNDFYCMGIEVSSNSHQTVLGMSFMKGFQVFFDRTEKTIGFLTAVCNIETRLSFVKSQEVSHDKLTIKPESDITIKEESSIKNILDSNTSSFTTQDAADKAESVVAAPFFNNTTIYPKVLIGFSLIVLLIYTIKILPSKLNRHQTVYDPIVPNLAPQEESDEQTTV